MLWCWQFYKPIAHSSYWCFTPICFWKIYGFYLHIYILIWLSVEGWFLQEDVMVSVRIGKCEIHSNDNVLQQQRPFYCLALCFWMVKLRCIFTASNVLKGTGTHGTFKCLRTRSWLHPFPQSKKSNLVLAKPAFYKALTFNLNTFIS